ncbi:MAG: type VII secretion protein EssC, partial [Clostridiales bacterium]|nr:type VII secretion protein EssC [Clostridiales bacterium]
MDNYKIVISSGNYYKEIILDPSMKRFVIGNKDDSDLVLKSESDISVVLEYEEENWTVSCEGDIYFLYSGVTKMITKQLNHGDELQFKMENTGREMFNLSFMLNFIFYDKKYEHSIDISNSDRVIIGRDSRYSIFLKDELLGADCVEIIHEQGRYTIKDNNTKYGVFVNGRLVNKQRELHEYDFIFILEYAFYFCEGHLYTDLSDQNLIVVNGLNVETILEQKSTLEYPKFNRNTRVKTHLSNEPIEILDPDAVREEPKKNLLLTLLPTVGTLGVSMFMRAMLFNRGKQILFLGIAMVGMGIITSVVTFVNEKKSYKRSVIERETKYTEYIKNKRVEIAKKREEELEALNAMYYSPEQELQMVEDFSADLFNRDVEDEDFLDVRLGTGFIEAKAKINYRARETLDTKDELALLPEQIADEYKYISKAPIVVSLNKINALGVVGTSEVRHAILRNMVIDIAVRQHYSNTKLYFMFPDEQKMNFQWVRYLPHLDNEDINARNIISDNESKTLIFDYLYKVLSYRESEKVEFPKIVVIVFDSVGLRKHPLSNYIEKANTLGATFVFFEELEEMLPNGCENIIRLDANENRGELLESGDSSVKLEFVYDAINPIDAEKLVMKLAPVYAEEISLDNTLTKNISLFELLKINNPKKIPIESNWNDSNVVKSMAAPLGVDAKNEVVALDIHEKYHGPHGLVAGTTGSGKSEILQSYILSMALRFHPYEVSFVIIDFKGGGMANQFATLPHLIGAITNIDDREIKRSLLSIKAELKKRQRLFAEAEVNHIDAYIKKYKNHEVQIPLPHLIVIVDEFAELKADQPEFMKELISAARIGRSLGVHLILATQKPSGVVDEQIWSNSKFKLCLKVQNKNDSNEVLKSPLAAEIREPGRAYFQVGNNEVFELFQSAYSGAPSTVSEDDVKPYKVFALNLSGKHSILYEQKKNSNAQSVLTQLESIVEAISGYCDDKKVPKLPPICLPPLEERVLINRKKINDSSIVIPIGVY